MKIAIFGATGGVGRELVKQALENGHEVTAFVRDASKVGVKNSNLGVVTGDVLDPDAVEEAVIGQDAVISALGTPSTVRNKTRSDGTRNIIAAMEKLGVKRLVSLSSLGIGDSRIQLPFLYKYILVPLLLKQGFAEHELQEKYVRESNTDWTLVRPGAYTNGPLTRNYQHGFPVTEKNIQAKISKADVANFMLKQVYDGTYIGKTPGLSY